MNAQGISNIEILDNILDNNEEKNGENEENKSKIITNWDESKPDPRLTRLSYSSCLLFQGCPRKYQLQKLREQSIISPAEWKQSLTFGFGHMVGEGIQHILEGRDWNHIIFNLFRKWKASHIFDENEKQKKSFFHAFLALQKFKAMQEDGFLEEYELAYYNGIPASELSFRINLPDDFTYRGYVDIVLKNKVTREFAIFEIKTNSGKFINHATYKNSSQATGYSVILDKIESGHTDYTVYYLVYMTNLERWECFDFPKSHRNRAIWIRDLMWDVDHILGYAKEEGTYGIWPVHGQHCVNYNRVCEFMDICHMDTKNLIVPLRENMLVEDKEYQFEFTLEELI